MGNPLQLSASQQFELERLSRVIEATRDPATLQGIARELLKLWQTQKAATNWAIHEATKPWAQVTPQEVEQELNKARVAAEEVERLNRLLQGGDEGAPA